jgi:pectate lyase
MRNSKPTYIGVTIVTAMIVLLVVGNSLCWAKGKAGSSKYLDAVRQFADNVLKYGRDTYGPKKTPLFVDGVNIHTHEPVKWIDPSGNRWILSNLASQQNLFRTLDGLTKITGNPKYRQAAVEATEYAFANLQAPNGLLYWGGGVVYDAQADEPRGIGRVGLHSLKCNYPYYKLMWEVDPTATRKFIEAYWATHILNWSNLAMNRGVPMDKVAGEPWNHRYRGGSVFFESSGIPFLVAGSDLICAAGFLGEASGDNQPLVWAKRLMHRYVETRSPGVGISGTHYTHYKTDNAQVQLGEDFRGHRVLEGTLFPSHPEMGDPKQLERYPAFVFVTPGIRHNPAIAPWASVLLLGDMLEADGKEFTRWSLEELTAWGKVAYRKEDNSFIPMLTDGTSLEGYVCKKSGKYGMEGTVFVPIQAIPMDFWTYALAYRLTGDQFMWDMARNIASGHGLGDIGVTPESGTKLETATECWSPYTLLGFVELYRTTQKQDLLKIAQRIGDNLLDQRFYKGFFVPSDKHIYIKFDTIEHMALLNLHASLKGTFSLVPEHWPSNSLFNAPYRDRGYASDYGAIYTLTKSRHSAESVEELIASGDIEGVRLFISQGGDVNAQGEGSSNTPLHWAVIHGQKDLLALLLGVDGIDIDVAGGLWLTPLHYAVKQGNKEIAELLIRSGADVNATDREGRVPLIHAVKESHKDLVDLLIKKGADVNARNKRGQTALYFARRLGKTELIDLLKKHGAKE